MEGVQVHELQKILQLRGSLQQTDDECGSMFFIGLACAMSENFCKDAREVIMLVAQIGSNNEQFFKLLSIWEDLSMWGNWWIWLMIMYLLVAKNWPDH